MTTATKHRERSHRSYGAKASMLGSIEHRNHISRASKQVNVEKSRMLRPLVTRLINLKDKLSANIANMFRRQDR